MKDEETLKKMTKLLEQGCTMLATHHNCGVPLFRCKGQVICPICSFQQGSDVETGKSSATLERGQEFVKSTHYPEAENAELHSEALESIPKQTEKIQDIGQTRSYLRVALMRKLKDLQKSMEEEEDLDRLSRLLECMEGIMRILKILE